MLALLPLLKSKLFECAVLVVLALACWGYFRWSQAEMSALHGQVALVLQQAADLKAANDAVAKQLAMLAQTQHDVQTHMNDAQDKALAAIHSLRSINLHKAAASNPAALEAQINQSWVASTQKIEAASHVPN